MKKVAKELHITTPFTLISCRHSWSTLALLKDVSIEYISSGLSHNSINTTKAYLKGFDSPYIHRVTTKIFEDL
jgi:integrase/recombinase XerD